MDTITNLLTGLITGALDLLYSLTGSFGATGFWFTIGALFTLIFAAKFFLQRDQPYESVRVLLAARAALVGAAFGSVSLVVMMFTKVTDPRWGSIPEQVSFGRLAGPDMSGVPAVGKSLDDLVSGVESGVNGVTDEVEQAVNQGLYAKGLAEAAYQTFQFALPFLIGAGIMLLMAVILRFAAGSVIKQLDQDAADAAAEVEAEAQKAADEAAAKAERERQAEIERLGAQLEALGKVLTNHAKAIKHTKAMIADPALAAAEAQKNAQEAAYQRQIEQFHRMPGFEQKERLPLSEHRDYVNDPSAYRSHYNDAQRNRAELAADRQTAGRSPRSPATKPLLVDPDRRHSNSLFEQIAGDR